jgi:hypothetical protein
MKSLLQIIAVLGTVNLLTTGSIVAQESRPEQRRQADETLVRKQAELAEKTAELSRRSAELAAADAQAQAELALKQVRGLTVPRARSSAEEVLVVLTAQTEAEELAKITEDLTIMSRILDKKLGRAQPAPSEAGQYLNIKFGNLFRRSWRVGATQIEAMYVQGHAALFFINVDFPLSPPPQVQTEKVKQGGDQVWEQTRWEMAASNIPLEYMHQRDAEARQYDKELVEQLKTNLIKTLKHAANIRNVKADESIVLAVSGPRPGIVVAEHGDEPHRYQYLLFDDRSPVLIVRAKKADIDAYSKDELDFEQFHQRVQILTSPPRLGAGQP